MIIDCISDLHGFYPELEGGDLLIVAGDLTTQDIPSQYNIFCEWIKKQSYKMRIVIGGNHDNWIQCAPFSVETMKVIGEFEYLCDSGTEFQGLKIWGSPWTKTFEGMNPNCKAFTVDTEEELSKYWDKIPDDIDILVTHSPIYGIFDEINDGWDREIPPNPYKKCVGSLSLRKQMHRIKPKLHICGHIHEWGGKSIDLLMTLCVNASLVNEHYQPVNKPLRVIL